MEDLRVGLSLSRNLRHDAPAQRGDRQERGGDSANRRGSLAGRLDGKLDLLKQVLALLSDHLKEAEAEDADRVLVDYLIARNTLDYPLDWLTYDLNVELEPLVRTADKRTHSEAMMAVQARLVPWEPRTSKSACCGCLFEGDRNQQRGLYDFWQPGDMLGSIRQLGPGYYADTRNGFERCRAPAMQLKLALRWYQAENGRPAENLEDLVPKYLPKVPGDPYQKGQPFHYRLSKGEKIVWPPEVPGGPPQPPVAPGGPPPPPPSVDVARDRASCGASAPTGRTTAACSRPARTAIRPSART